MINFKIFFFAMFSFLSISSCRIYAPTFKTVENLKFERVGLTGVSVGADMVFHNPNFVRCKVSDLAVDVLVNKKVVGTVGKKSDMIVKPKRDFVFPIGLNVQAESSFLENLKTVLDVFKQKQVDLQFQGKIRLKVLCKTYPLNINYSQSISSRGVKK